MGAFWGRGGGFQSDSLARSRLYLSGIVGLGNLGQGAFYASLPNFSEGVGHQVALVPSDPEQGKYCVPGRAYLNHSEETKIFLEGLREASWLPVPA